MAALRCPVCSAAVDEVGGGIICPAGHRFDRARQGYLSLLGGAPRRHLSDTATMVAARRRILDAGVFNAVSGALAREIDPAARLIVDAGAGTGHYLAAALEAAPTAGGIGADLSKYCARALARAHPRALAVVADVWSPLPIASASTDTVLSVFAPRNAAETARILAPGGHWLIITPNPAHLAQVREPLGMLDIGSGKLARLHKDLAAAGLAVRRSRSVTACVALTAESLADLAGMGPAGFHRTGEQLAAAAARLAGPGETATATIDVTLSVAGRS
ncbi:putative methyltransferase [Gordonia hirsuta DSM 44140 = NBRC 16056]|uniref:Putative methyltransferase n=1 Tax=Gordonia hirsuta DSM 44140 = NBRC 16056 TaxID=1121927 RepID=L7L839_9ACTN|nr:methyltransferase domain-containing protein [Gordonia hirsuta]GAC56217.1 putative methyltransferase [Gordonia hirsuta DSM 44140 = NBRC 16056]